MYGCESWPIKKATNDEKESLSRDYDPMDCSLPGVFVHRILQARILEWVAIPFSRDPPDPEIEPGSPALQADTLLPEPPWKPKDDWELKNWCFWIVVPEKTLESPLDSKEIKSVNPKGNQLWIFIGRTNAKAEAPKLWLPDVKKWLIGKDPDAGKDLRQKKRACYEMVT